MYFIYTLHILEYYFDILAKFGPWKYGPQHGFARVLRWKVEMQPKKVSGVFSNMFQISELKCLPSPSVV